VIRDSGTATDAPPDAIGRRHVVALVAIAILGFVLRLSYLLHAINTPGFVWEDPDGYMTQALKLAGGGHSWRWTFDAVTYSINAQHHALPPMYSAFLSVFALFPGFPLSAQVAQVVLATLAIVLMFELGRLLHSPATGLVAAAAYAIWIPNIFNVWSTSQETLYLPLILLAFVLLSRALIRQSSITFGLAGVVFGLAALTRSMPLFFVPPAAALCTLLDVDRRRGARHAIVLAVAFLLIVGPYSLALSRHFGQLTVIDTHGSIHLETKTGARAAGLLETAGALWRSIQAAPIDFASGALARVRSLLHVNGGRILQIYVVAGSRLQARLFEAAVHIGTDALLICSTLLAGIGAALCRRPRIAWLLFLWTGVNVAIASVGGFGGARLRVPFEPMLMVMAAVCVTGAWQRRRRLGLVAGTTLGILAATATLPQLPRSLDARADYGVAWPSIFSRSTGRFERRAGLTIPVRDGFASLGVTSDETTRPIRVHVRVNSVLVQTSDLSPGQNRMMRLLAPDRAFAFVEIEALDMAPPHLPLRIFVPDR
jgi:4-amino-4-deoxy-L-arabinose transferase-like glycosyltransferase